MNVKNKKGEDELIKWIEGQVNVMGVKSKKEDEELAHNSLKKFKILNANIIWRPATLQFYTPPKVLKTLPTWCDISGRYLGPLTL